MNTIIVPIEELEKDHTIAMKVFVRPFQKGKERGKTAPKEHIYVV